MKFQSSMLDRQMLEDRYADWQRRIEVMHADARHTTNDRVHTARLRVPLSEASIALVSTAGVHLVDQPEYDLENPYGDPSYREIPGDADSSRLRLSHSHYDHRQADTDPNVVFPIDRLRELAGEGFIAGPAPLHFGLMGFNPNPARLIEETLPVVVRALGDSGADAVLLTPG